MTWSNPKTDWDTDDGITTTDLNRIETNINGTRFGQNDLGANVASAANLDITKDYHVVTGTTDIYYMSIVAYQPGARVFLKFEDNLNIYSDATPAPTNYKPLKCRLGGGSYGTISTTIRATIEFVFDGNYWYSVGYWSNS